MAGIGAARLTADATVTILEVSSATAGPAATDRAYCLVKTRVGDNVNIWVALPSADWNGRLRAEGNGVFGGASQLVVPVDSVRQGLSASRPTPATPAPHAARCPTSSTAAGA